MNADLTHPACYLGNPGVGWNVAAIGDYDGDGNADIRFRNSSGATCLWALQGGTVIGQAYLGNPGTAWHVVGAAQSATLFV